MLEYMQSLLEELGFDKPWKAVSQPALWAPEATLALFACNAYN
jgi:hypothetical protein